MNCETINLIASKRKKSLKKIKEIDKKGENNLKHRENNVEVIQEI